MYQLHVSIQETIGAYICAATISEVDQWGRVTTLAKARKAFLSQSDDGIPEDLGELFKCLERYAAILAESP